MSKKNPRPKATEGRLRVVSLSGSVNQSESADPPALRLPPGPKEFPYSHKHTWEDALRDTAKVDMPTERKTDCNQAIRHLQGLLLESKSESIVLDQLRNLAPWARYWVLWLSRLLNSLERSVGFESVTKRLRSPDGFREVCSVLSVAQFFVGPELAIQFEPQATASSDRRADLLVRHPASGEELFIEVSDQQTPRTIDEAMKTTNAVMFPVSFGPYILRFSGRIDVVLTEDKDLEALSSKVRRAAQEAFEGRSLVVLDLDNVGLLALAHPEACDELDSWARSNGLEPNSLDGPATRAGYERRISAKLRDKTRQLPPGRPGILVIHPAPEDRMFFEHSLAKRLVDDHNDLLASRSQLVAVCVPAESLDGHTFTAQLPYGELINFALSPWGARSYHWVPNPHAQVPLPKRLLAVARSRVLSEGANPAIDY